MGEHVTHAPTIQQRRPTRLIVGESVERREQPLMRRRASLHVPIEITVEITVEITLAFVSVR
jgi:hypothetical protein